MANGTRINPIGAAIAGAAIGAAAVALSNKQTREKLKKTGMKAVSDLQGLKDKAEDTVKETKKTATKRLSKLKS